MAKQLLRVIPLALIVVASALVLTACPPPISPALANVVQDTIAPVIFITSPADNSSFRSSLTVTGTVTDSSKAADDGLGVLESISFEVGGAEYLSRTLIFVDGAITFDPPELEFTSYDPETGAFEITFSTAAPLLTGFRQITISATDQKGHVSEEQITVFAYTEGPHVELTEPEDLQRHESSMTISGRVANSSADPLTSNVDPDGLVYKMYTDQPVSIPFDPDTGEFSIVHDFVSLPTGNIPLTVTAKDLSGYENSVSVTLTDEARAALVFTEPNADLTAYYSSALGSTSVIFSGSPVDPDEVYQIVYDLTGTTTQGDTPISYSTGDPTFSFAVDPTVVGPGNVTIRVKGIDLRDRINTHVGVLTDDPNSPTAGGVLVGANIYVDLTFNEPVWGNLNQTGPVTTAHFRTDAPEGDPTITSVTTPAGGALTGGESAVRLALDFGSNKPNLNDPLVIDAAPGLPPYDRANNEWTGSVTLPLQDQKAPEIDSVDIGTITNGLSGTSEFVNEGDLVEFVVTFSETVAITGSPRIHLDLDGNGTPDGPYAQGSAGSGVTHSFIYTVGAGENTPVDRSSFLDVAAGDLDLNGGTILDGTPLPLDQTLPGNALTTDVVVDTDSPVSAATPLTIAATGGTNQIADYTNGENTDLDITADLIDTSGDPSLVEGWVEVLRNGGPITETPVNVGQIGGPSVNFMLLQSASISNLQDAIPSGDYTMSTRLYDAAGNASSATGATAPLTGDYIPPGAPSGIDVDGDGASPVDGYINNYDDGLTASAIVPIDTANGRVARLYRSGSGTPIATDSSILSADTSVAFTVADVDWGDGPYTITVEIQDAAGNIATGTMPGTLTVDQALPPDPTSVLATADLALAGYANAATTEIVVTASIAGGAADWVAELLIGDPTGVPLVPAVTQTNLTSGISLTIDNASNPVPVGAQRFTILVTKPSGNLSIPANSDTITVDYTAPTVSGATSYDTDSDGDAETLAVTFSENVDHASVDETNWHMRSAFGPGTVDSFETGEYSDTGATSGTFVLAPSSPGFFGSGTMQITIDADGIRDLAGNPIAVVGSWTTISVADAAIPLVKSSYSLDDNHDGASNIVEIEFTEPMDDSTFVLWNGVDTYYWHMEVDQVGSETQVAGDFSSSSTTVTVDDLTNEIPPDDDPYLQFSMTPPSGSVGTGTTAIWFDGGYIEDLNGLSIAEISYANRIVVTDRARAVLLLASVSNEGGTSDIFNDNDDDLRLTFSEVLADVATDDWSELHAEAIFEFGQDGGGFTVDGHNFHEDVGDSNTVPMAIHRLDGASGYPNTPWVLRLSPTNNDDALNLIEVGSSTVAIVANAPNDGSSTINFNDANGYGVYEGSTPVASFSVIGSSGSPGGGKVVITGGGSTASGPAARGTSETLLVLPANWPGSQQTASGAGGGGNATPAAPYEAPAVARLRQETAAAAAAAQGVQRSVVTPQAAPSEVSSKVPNCVPKSLASLTPAESVPLSAPDSGDPAIAAATPPGPASGSNEEPVVVAQSSSNDPSPAGATGSGRTVASRGDTATRNSTAAILALIAIMAIFAGGALMVLSRLGRSRGKVRSENGKSRVE
jgi:hypothetical protein